MRVRVAAILLLSFLFVGCPPPSAHQYLVVIDGPASDTRAMLDRAASALMREFKTREIWRRDGDIWLCREFAPSGIFVELQLHRKSGRFLIEVHDRGGKRFTPVGDDVLVRGSAALQRAITPATLHQMSDSEVSKLFGDQLQLTCQ